MDKKYSVKGMTCGHCAMHVKDALEKVNGVSAAKVNNETGEAVVTFGTEVNIETLKSAVSETGYTLVSEII
ncbi:MAG: cation transporter [Spirochaetaceae bacterium]|nr:cation transporter [Spirochaetaceae bacterium]